MPTTRKTAPKNPMRGSGNEYGLWRRQRAEERQEQSDVHAILKAN